MVRPPRIAVQRVSVVERCREELVDEMSWNGGGSVSIASIRDCQARRMSYDIEVSPIPDQATVERTIGPVSVWPEPYWQLSIRQPDDDSSSDEMCGPLHATAFAVRADSVGGISPPPYVRQCAARKFCGARESVSSANAVP